MFFKDFIENNRSILSYFATWVVILIIIAFVYMLIKTKNNYNLDEQYKNVINYVVENGDDCVGTVHVLSSNSVFVEFGCITPFMKKYSYNIRNIVYCDGLHGKAGFLIVLNNINLYYDNSLERNE